MEATAHSPEDRVIIFGSTGFVGSRLLPELTKRNVRLRLFVRDKARASALAAGNGEVEIFEGDLLSGKGLREALHGIHSAYYLVHSMGGKSLFRNAEYAGPGLQVSIKMEKIRFGISSCLLGEKIRYHPIRDATGHG